MEGNKYFYKDPSGNVLPLCHPSQQKKERLFYQPLQELKHLGLIKGNVQGTNVCYCINKNNWSKMNEVMLQFLNQDTTKENCW